ncbi:GNAT family N-acetyltransferase [Cypionkella sp.]|uniref:GNAT family N-acetyltransferase n=1 Tax=Cypionkella sp. TaxID=2811411 RepID=UPI0026142091|nr:GNAT family N-acetyltransferase [Cypionkella sp.]
MAVIFRDAQPSDVAAMVAMLADDPLGKAREGGDMAPYLAAFDEIIGNPMHQMIVGETGGRIVAMCQLTILAGLSRQGARRALVEAVRVVADLRGQKLGEALMAECESRARAAGALVMQLTTDKTRLRAHAFYDRLGFTASHIGYKKNL